MSEIGSALRIGRRVVVTGMAGAGKSTFARQLSAKTGLLVIHLDVHFWKPGWVEPSDKEWRDVQSALLAGEAWIADGNYHETLDLRLARGYGCVPRHAMVGLRSARVRAWVASSGGSVARRLRDDGVATVA